eukprot:10002069-Karenia_brevis.AAC.1
MIDTYLANASPGVQGLRKILDHVKVSASGDSVGLSWLEIFILSTAASTSPSMLTHSNTARSHPSLAIQLKEFISSSHGFLHFSTLPHFADLFHAHASTQNRLLHYGILSHFTHTKVFFELPSYLTDLLELVLLQLQSHLTRDQLRAHAEGTLQIKTRRYKGLGVLTCEAAIRRLHRALCDFLSVSSCIARQPQPGNATAFSCPAGHTRPAQAPFDPYRPTKQIWCKLCTRSVAGSSWVC